MAMYTAGAKEYLNTFYSSDKIDNYDWNEWFKFTKDENERQAFCDLALEITAGCTTQEEKINAIYDWVRTNMTYNLSGTYYDIYEALTKREGVCAQYAGIMHQLLISLDIPCLMVEGYLLQFSIPINSSYLFDQTINGTDSHAWVVVYDGTEWQYYDPTNSMTFDLDTYYVEDRGVYFVPCTIQMGSFYSEGMNPYRGFIGNGMVYYEGHWYHPNNDYWLIPGDYLGYEFGSGTANNQFTNDVYTLFLYSFDENGDLKTGLINRYSDYYCYILETGMMLSNCSIIVDGIEYTFDSNGMCYMP